MDSYGNTVKDVDSQVRTGISSLAENAGSVAQAASERVKQYTAKAKEVIHDVNNASLADMETKVGTYVSHNPGVSILAAATAGFVIAALVFRR